jgi:CBS domain-containing protein
MPELSPQNKAQRLRIYISESDRWRGKALDSALLDLLRAQKAAGATVFRGMAGFGAHSHLHSSSIEVLSMDLPVVVEVVDTPEKISSILALVYPMVGEGLITLEDVRVVKYTHCFLNLLPADRLVAEVMTREVFVLKASMPVHQAWRDMLSNRMKAMPVLDEADRVVGILTNEDLLERAGIQQRLSIAIRMDAAEINAEMRSLENSPLTVADVMTTPVVTTLESESLGAAVSRMVKAGLKRLPVMDKNEKLVGMLSRLDVLRQVADSSSSPQTRAGMRTVKEVMSQDVPLIHQTDGLAAIIQKLIQTGSNRLVVVDEAGKAIGVVSDSDVVARIQPTRRRSILEAFRQIGAPPPGAETARELMSPQALTARSEEHTSELQSR